MSREMYIENPFLDGRESITNEITKYAETKNNVILNGVVYNKYNTDVKIPINTVNIKGKNKLPILKKMCRLCNKNDSGSDKQNYFDKLNLEKVNNTFLIGLKENASEDGYLNCLEEDTKIYNIFASNIGGSFLIDYDEINDILYYLRKGSSYIYMTNKRGSIDKFGMGISTNSIYYTIVFSNNDLILTISSNGNGSTIYHKLSKYKEGINLSDATSSQNLYLSYLIYPTRLINGNYYYTICSSSSNGNESKLYKNSVINDQITCKEIKTFENFEIYFYGSLNEKDNIYLTTYNYFFEKDNKKYLIYLKTLDNYYLYQQLQYGYIPQEKVLNKHAYLLEVNDDGIVNEVNIIDVLDNETERNIYYTSIYDEDTKRLYLGNPNYIDVYNIDETLKFQKVFRIELSNNIASYGFNRQNEFIISDIKSNIFNFDIGTGVMIEKIFEKDSFCYYGEDINSYLKVGVKNYLGQYSDQKIKIRLVGNVTFEDNQKEKIITTSKNGLTQIPIIIKGASQIDAEISYYIESN